MQSAGDCGSCHTGSGSKDPLALHTRQLNKVFDYSGVLDNQLDAFNYVGLFDQTINSGSDYNAFAAIDDETSSTSLRARSYMDTNCSHCHSSSFMDLQFDTPLMETRLLDVQTTSDKVRLRPFDHANSLVYIYQTSDGNRMPKGSRYTNPLAQTVVEQWINAEDATQVGIELFSSGTRFAVGDSVRLDVKALYDNEFPLDNLDPVIWGSSNNAVVSVANTDENTQTLALNTVGTATVTVHAGGYSDQISITVTDSDASIVGLEIFLLT